MIYIGESYIVHVRINYWFLHYDIKMMYKQDFENYESELQTKIENKITEAINRLNEEITVKLENNKVEIIQSLKNEF